MILIHGRGASAQSILGLSRELSHDAMAYLAPQASGHTWYPYSFLAPIDQNEPGLSSGLQAIGDLVQHVEASGISSDHIVLGGFSQGACLTSEYAARFPRRYGGLLVFSGGVIGPPESARDYEGSLEGTPVFIGCSEADFHIPVERVHETADAFAGMGASVTKKIYPADMGHTIVPDEIEEAMKIVSRIA
jgi:glyoxalase family protein